MTYLITWFVFGNAYLFYRTFKITNNVKLSYTGNENFTLFHVVEIMFFAFLFPVFLIFDFLMWSKTIKFF